ncbi:hypothetical protein [Nonomuraea sp. NPDC049646]|uniref:hypothetical protein n=1 Tax=unclassified Nonomuraea TaxID=2593643 RepID=UPI0037B5D9C6
MSDSLRDRLAAADALSGQATGPADPLHGEAMAIAADVARQALRDIARALKADRS